MEDKRRWQQIMELEHFHELTPIQKEVLKYSNSHRDLIGVSSTGSGKSHAFFMRIFELLDFEKEEVQAVISAPTRELAYQLYDRAKKIADYFHIRVQLFTGGMEKKQNARMPHVVIGTPGRLKDEFLDTQSLRLDTAKVMVIDEADMTLEFGFLEDIDAILSKMDKKIQLMVFSATVPEALQPFLKKYLYDPQWIRIEDSFNYQSDVEHVLVPCKHKSYFDKCLDVLKHIQPYVCLIFTNTNTQASQLAKFLREHNYDLVELHGNLEARERMQAIKMIQSQKKSYIVASDIASRGIDLDGVTHVISCGFPKDLKFYVHRSGRTGRANRDGICYALYKEEDRKSINDLANMGIQFEHKDIKNGSWVDLKPYFNVKMTKVDPLKNEISSIVKKKKKKVKPNYKKKQRDEIERLRRKKKREIIQKDIARQKKERAKEKQREKRNEF